MVERTLPQKRSLKAAGVVVPAIVEVVPCGICKQTRVHLEPFGKNVRYLL